jgi:hypothetical protein
MTSSEPLAPVADWRCGPANGPSRIAGTADGPLGLPDRDWCTTAVEMAAKVYLMIEG